jgi:hypothetical protein
MEIRSGFCHCAITASMSIASIHGSGRMPTAHCAGLRLRRRQVSGRSPWYDLIDNGLIDSLIDGATANRYI